MMRGICWHRVAFPMHLVFPILPWHEDYVLRVFNRGIDGGIQKPCQTVAFEHGHHILFYIAKYWVTNVDIKSRRSMENVLHLEIGRRAHWTGVVCHLECEIMQGACC
jgi:hypothetical protein